jgi:hypothetical protein
MAKNTPVSKHHAAEKEDENNGQDTHVSNINAAHEIV